MGKKKIHELAKELGITSKELIEKVNKMGMDVKSHMSVLEDADLEKVKASLGKGEKKDSPKVQEKAVERKPQPATDRGEFKKREQQREPQREPQRAQQNDRNRQRPNRTGEGGERRPYKDFSQGDRERSRDNRENRDNRDRRDKDERPQQNRQVRQKDSAKKSGDDLIEKKSASRRERESKYKEKNKQMDPVESKGMRNKKTSKNQMKNVQPPDLKKAHKGKSSKYKQQKLEKQVEQMPEEVVIPEGSIVINVPITVAGFAEQVEVSISQVIMALMKLGIMANMNQNIDEDTVLILGAEMGIEIVIGNVEDEIQEAGIESFEDKEEDLKNRPPIITVMGHVDHGKTSLLDAIRKTSVTATESGGITQHIGASEVHVNGQKIVFLDTPGHEAFTAMRARGAHVTDIAILVVAADDSVKPQTVESISHAKAAGVPIIVAINKMDKPGANPDMVKKDLTEHGILVEDWGGETISVPVSAKSGEGIDNLLEMILLQAEVLELKANPDRKAHGTVIEARLDKAKGPVATLLVLNGTLKSGDSVVAGTCSGRIRAMTNFKGELIKKAGPGTAVEILGLTEVPEAGDEFHSVKDDRVARDIAESRKGKLREEVLARNSSTTLEKLFSQIQEGEEKILNLIIKGDVQGSVGALITSLEKLKNENVRVKIIHSGVGTVTESDIMLANTSGAVIIAFNVRPSSTITSLAESKGIEIRTYRVIYDVIDDVEAAMKGMLDPVFKEVVMGKIEIRDTFKVPGIGIVGGAYVLEGKVQRNADVRLVRDGIVIHEGKISSLKRFKDDAKEVSQGYECGIGLENYNDIKIGDEIEAFKIEEIERK